MSRFQVELSRQGAINVELGDIPPGRPHANVGDVTHQELQDEITARMLADEQLGARIDAIVADAGSGRVLVDVPASDATVDKIIIEDSQLYTTRDRVTHEAVPQQVTFANQRFDLGYFGDESALDANFYVVGRYYYNFVKYTPRVVAYIAGNRGPKHWIDANAADLVADITGDVGHFPTDDAAEPHITQVGDVFYHERLRVYRRATAIVPGMDKITRKERLRQANEDDIARLDRDQRAAFAGAVDFVMAVSPASVDPDNFPSAVQVTMNVAGGKFAGSSMRLSIFGQQIPIPAGAGEDRYDPDAKRYRISVPTTPTMLANVKAALVGAGRRSYYNADCSILGGDDGNTELASASYRVAINPSASIADLKQRTSDLRVSAPPGWEVAVGNGVGIALSPRLVADVSTLAYAATADIPADAEPGDDLLLYMSVPTGSNLSDYRANLAGFAELAGFNFGEVAVNGDNTVYSYLFTVGNDSGGFASGFAAGRRITLEHHGTTPHTAYSGDLEGRALAQVEAAVAAGGQPAPAPGGDDLPAIPENGRTYTLQGRDNLGDGGANDPIRFWADPNYVPDTPGTATGIGHVLTATGQNDKDYAFRALPAASEAAAGVVRAGSQTQSQAASGSVSVAWSLDRLKEIIRRNLPAATTSQRGGVLAISQAIFDAGSSTANFAWNIANILRAARSVVATWAERNDVSTIPINKLGSGAATGSKFLRDDNTWREPGTAAGISHLADDLEAKTADLSISDHARWSTVPQLADAQSPIEAQRRDNLGPALNWKPDTDGTPGRDSETWADAAQYNAASWRNGYESEVAPLGSGAPEQGGYAGTLWIRLPADADLNHYRLVTAYAGQVSVVGLTRIAELWDGLDADGILQGQKLYRITRATQGARVPFSAEDLKLAGLKLQVPGGGSISLQRRDAAAAQHTRFDGNLGAGPLEQVSEVADAAALPKAQIIDLPLDQVNDVTWNVDDGEIASILLTESMKLRMSGGVPGRVAYLFVRAPGGLKWTIELVGITNRAAKSTVIQGSGTNVLKFIKAGVHVRGADGSDTTAWHYLGFDDRQPFDVPVGASPAILPEGTRMLSFSGITNTGNAANRRLHTRSILVSQLPVAATKWSMESGNAGNVSAARDVDVQLAYVAATRQLTYSRSGVALADFAIRAIGEA